MVERKSDRWISFTQSVLLHGVVVGALAYGFYAYKQRPKIPTPTLAVEGTLVSSKDLKPVQPTAKPTPPPPEPEKPPEPVEDVGPPTPTPEDTQKREQEEREAAEAKQKLEEQRQAEEQKQAQEQERKVAEQKVADEKAAMEKAAAQKAAALKAAADQKAREDAAKKKREQEQREAEQKRADDQRKAAEAKARAESEAELRKSLEQEEHAQALRSSGALQSWLAQIANRIQRAWLRPPSAKPGIDCMVYVTQVPGGVVTNVRVGTCNGDAAVRESIESAVLRASPLPPPPDPSLFERDLEIRFIPAD